MTGRDPSRKVNNVSNSFWDWKIIPEFTSPSVQSDITVSEEKYIRRRIDWKALAILNEIGVKTVHKEESGNDRG